LKKRIPKHNSRASKKEKDRQKEKDELSKLPPEKLLEMAQSLVDKMMRGSELTDSDEFGVSDDEDEEEEVGNEKESPLSENEELEPELKDLDDFISQYVDQKKK